MQNNIIEYVKTLKAKGVSTNDIAVEFDVAPSTVRRWLSGQMVPKSDRFQHIKPITSSEEFFESDVETSNDVTDSPTFYIKPTFTKQEEIEDLKEFITSLSPINYPAPTKPNVLQTPNKIAMVIGDTHFGCEDQATIDLFLKAVDELKPETVVLNGDLLDMFAVSKYPKDIRYSYSLSQERNAYHKFLKQLHDITVAYNTDIYETSANHSGDGTEGRWWRYLSSRLGEISDLPEVIESLSYENIFFPRADWSRVKLVDYVELASSFVVLHGDVVRKRGGMSAVGMLEKFYTSIIMNHTHRMGMTARRMPSIGSKEEKIIRVYENACACNLRPCYSSAADWQNGFCVVNYSDGANIAVEQVLVENKSCSISTLGKTLKVRN